ncbi:hypothetical protein BX666DRAFT_1309002 [Dichotomocladium elegans]|nr:hypothetical protein BX666DRAFT_1309002 [Dichotomocladium elegans]
MIGPISSSFTTSSTTFSGPKASSAIIPLANRLSKLTALPFGRTKWQARFFILLDSELRMYKDEFADTPCDTLSLHHVKTILPLTIGPHAHCLRLEPHLPHDKALTLDCPSQHDRDVWLHAIRARLEKSKRAAHQQPSETCKVSSLSLSSRRGIMLSPLTISTGLGLVVANDRDRNGDDEATTMASVPEFSSSSSATTVSASSYASLSPPPSYVYERSMSVPTITLPISSTIQQQQQDGETSPSFLKYKQQFHLC